MTYQDYEVRACSKSELALAYSPHMAPHSATNRLGEWIRRNSALTAELASSGYRIHQRVLTAKQVEIIVTHLGEP